MACFMETLTQTILEVSFFFLPDLTLHVGSEVIIIYTFFLGGGGAGEVYSYLFEFLKVGHVSAEKDLFVS